MNAGVVLSVTTNALAAFTYSRVRRFIFITPPVATSLVKN